MSLSVGGYSHPGFPHPGPMSHDFYQYQQMARYPDHCPDATYFQNWVLNGVNGHHSDIPVSPESYGMCTPSPTEYHSIGGEHYYPNFDRCLKRRSTANKKERLGLKVLTQLSLNSGDVFQMCHRTQSYPKLKLFDWQLVT